MGSYYPRRVFLVQHGKCTTEQENPDRPLTEEGSNDTEKIASYLLKLNAEISCCFSGVQQIWHSKKLRARQTGEIFLKALGNKAQLVEKSNLSPNDSVEKFIEVDLTPADGLKQSVLIAGHLPFLEKLCSALLQHKIWVEDGKGEEKLDELVGKLCPVVKFKNSGCVCMENEKEGSGWVVRWAVTPGMEK